MALSPELKRMVSEAKARYRGYAAENRVPNSASFAKLSFVDQVATIEAVQRELDYLTEGVRSGVITSNHRGRGAALRGIRARQMRLNRLAAAFGFRREWRMHVRVKAISQPHGAGS